jgi:hypothetical protein
MLRSRFSSNAPLVVFIGVFALLGSQTASAEGDRHVSLRFAGDFVQNLEQMDVDGNGVSIGMSSALGLIRAKVKGNLGRADLTAVTKTEGVVPVPDSKCPDDFVKVADITDNNLVFTFSDLSLLYGDGQGVVCINFANGEQYAAAEGMWLGGTARFRNAKGEFSIRFDEFALVSSNTQVVAEAGTITGTLSRDH